MVKKKIAIVGAGSFGTALAKLVSSYENCEVIVWSAVSLEIENILKSGGNFKCLPGVFLDLEKVKLTLDVRDLSCADIVIFSVASVYVREVSRMVAPFLKKETIVVNVAKGLERSSFKRLLEVLREEIKFCDLVVLSGPSHAEEISKNVPTTVVVASENVESARKVQSVLNSSQFRVYVSYDVVGVELGGALKNIIAFAVGICCGLNLGDNAKAALMTRGIAEIGRLGIKLGAKNETFAGLSGIGDLIVTCISVHSRNRRAGILVGQGLKPREALKQVGMTVEGYLMTEIAYKLSKLKNISMPITQELYRVLYEDFDVKLAWQNLMNRPYKDEIEEVWFKN